MPSGSDPQQAASSIADMSLLSTRLQCLELAASSAPVAPASGIPPWVMDPAMAQSMELSGASMPEAIGPEQGAQPDIFETLEDQEQEVQEGQEPEVPDREETSGGEPGGDELSDSEHPPAEREHTNNPSELAHQTLKGATSPLPHIERIQAAFGRHDVKNTRAVIGGAAEEASADLGVDAFALGDRVAFAAEPDLHVAAHEAAHVVQQRHGVGSSNCSRSR